MSRPMAALSLLALAACAHAQEAPRLHNSGFEEVAQGVVPADIGFGVWVLGEDRLVPVGWTLNPAFPGTLTVAAEGARSGERAVRIHANGPRGDAHLFQPCPGITAGQAYQVSAWVRGGPARIVCYEYYPEGVIKTPTILSAAEPAEEWHRLSGYYFPEGADLRSVSLAVVAPKDSIMEVDDIAVTPAPDLSLPADLQPITLETDLLRFTLSPDGKLQEFTDKASGANHARPGTGSVFRASRGGSEIPVRAVTRQGSVLDVQFADPGVKATFRVGLYPTYLTLELRSVTGEGVDWVQLAYLPLSLSGSIGTLLNVAWDDDFAACVLACNEQTHSFGASGSEANLAARCYRDYGMPGAKIAVIGTPLAPAGSTDALLDVIERVELDQGLPHPTIDGVWIKRAPQRFSSYLMAAGASEANIDDVVEFARGGFGCVELLNWWNSTPEYEPHPGLFPNGLEGMKACADKIHAAGMEVGLHAMQAMVGWGGTGMRNKYILPEADPRLLRDRFTPLAAAISADATELPVQGPLDDWPEKGDLFVEGELIRYTGRGESTFTGCTRGLHGTTTKEHAAGTEVGHMVNCFPMWDAVIYAPHVESTLVDEACRNIARIFNATGADMSYFDAGEEIAVQPPSWRNQGRVALGVFDRIDKPVILEGNALYTNLSWHVITRGSPTFDPIYYGRRGYTLRGKGQNPAGWRKNLLTGDVGWFEAHVRSDSTYAVTPDEVLLLCLKALGGDAPISFQVHCSNLYGNKRMPEMLSIIRACDALKREQYFTPEVRRRLSTPMAEFNLDQSAEGDWRVRPMEFGPSQVVDAESETGCLVRLQNPYAPQRPWVRVRALGEPAAYGAEGNIVLADFAEGVPFTADGSASEELTCAAEPAEEQTPDGAAAFCFRAKNAARAPSSWCRLSLPFDNTLNLSGHRRLGLWVKGEGKGGILNVQLLQGHGYRDHYIGLDYEGWRYHELMVAEADRYYEHKWPYSWIDVLYWTFRYGQIKAINLYYNGLPAESETSCLIGRIEALREGDGPLVSPSLEVAGKRLTIPVSLQPEEYVEIDWEGECRHFEPNGGVLGEPVPVGEIELPAGGVELAFSCEAADGRSAHAEVTVCSQGEPVDNTPPAAAVAPAAPADEPLQLMRTTSGNYRVVAGRFERVGRSPARAIAAFDGAANVWTESNPLATPVGGAIVVDYGGKATAPQETEGSALLDDFSDLAAYAESAQNQYAQYVQGGGRQLTAEGPVREGVSQSLTAAGAGPREELSAAEYSAHNQGVAGGWCGKGRRFEPAVDLSAAKILTLWVRGDGGGQVLKVQFRDRAGAWADWTLPIGFSGWYRAAFQPTAAGIDWSQIEYVIFYYNDLRAGARATVGLSDLRAYPTLQEAPPLEGLSVVVNGTRLQVAERLLPGEAATLDGAGRRTLLRPDMKRSQAQEAAGEPLVLRPGDNEIQITSDNAQEVRGGVSVTVLQLGPAG